MKGFVFTFRNNPKALRLPDLHQSGRDFRQLLRRYGVQAVFAALFLLGLIIGAVSGRGFGKETFEKLDLLFVTNIDARMDMSVFNIFVSCFVSYFLFIFCVFLSGFSVWGFLTVPMLSAVKGFTVGLSSAFVFSQYRLSGIGFYILVVLPGTVLFLFALVRYATYGFRMSLGFLRLSMLGCEHEPQLSVHIKAFVKKTIFALLSVGGCAVVDMVLWVLFANKFDF
ncbi:MAG: stage II sporulation protein M [Ruminococcus sp.]|uniref:stage II sporulation protein M n=1 Tax=Ruminococcus sp. TaxID=41978 RepID=UPI0028737E06|nr:stage II sporulation protein M [Ruminococcus sp.]MBQ3284099.1 stage II sporulation protein M [Ruminococcus sp.]